MESAYRGLQNVCNRNVKSEKATTFLIINGRPNILSSVVGLGVGCHKFATRIHTCTLLGGDFEFEKSCMREFAIAFLWCQPTCKPLALTTIR